MSITTVISQYLVGAANLTAKTVIDLDTMFNGTLMGWAALFRNFVFL